MKTCLQTRRIQDDDARSPSFHLVVPITEHRAGPRHSLSIFRGTHVLRLEMVARGPSLRRRDAAAPKMLQVFGLDRRCQVTDGHPTPTASGSRAPTGTLSYRTFGAYRSETRARGAPPRLVSTHAHWLSSRDKRQQ